jgi:hypothetical protein
MPFFIDLVTVVFEPELPVLRAQAQSINLYCRDLGINTIYVIVNDHDSVVKQIDTAWWGDMQHRVVILPRRAFSTDFVEDGWISQQVLKVLGAATSFNTWSMVLDAKTLFVKPLRFDDLMDSQGRAQTGALGIQPVFESSSTRVGQLFGVDVTRQLGPGGVPFLFNTRLVRAMIVDIEHRTGESFPTWFQAQGEVTEFILYSGYLESRHMMDLLYNTQRSKLYACNLCHSEVESFDRKFQEMQNSLTTSIHRNAWSRLSQEQQQRYHAFLVQRGITL